MITGYKVIILHVINHFDRIMQNIRDKFLKLKLRLILCKYKFYGIYFLKIDYSGL